MQIQFDSDFLQLYVTIPPNRGTPERRTYANDIFFSFEKMRLWFSNAYIMEKKKKNNKKKKWHRFDLCSR